MYFRQDKSDGIKLPIKWMAFKSIDDGIFSEKTDVVNYFLECITYLINIISCILFSSLMESLVVKYLLVERFHMDGLLQ